ncbi:hypothetical protein [Micromonospora chalcea]|uniref:hypothetical protein n=1 Tax=Micromonospora chalcea TaxID=1874 RepID=UPI0037F37ABC
MIEDSPRFGVKRDRAGLVAAPRRDRKSNRNLLHALVTTTLLALAKDRAPQVEGRFKAYHSDNNVARSLIGATKADSYDPEIRKDFLEYAPAIVRSLTLIDEDKASDFTSLRHLQVNGQAVMMGLDRRGRFALSVIKDICGDTVEAALEPVLRELTARLDNQADEHLRIHWEASTFTAAKTNVLHVHVTDFHRDGATITVSFLGGVCRDFDVSTTDHHEHGGSRALSEPPERLQVGVTFEMIACWELSTATGTPRAVTINSTEYEIDKAHPW